jgi:hypothetical protein
MQKTLRRGVILLFAGVAAFASCRDTPTQPQLAGVLARSDTGRKNAFEPSDSTAVLVGAGNVGTCTSSNDEATGALLDGIGGTVVTIGNSTLNGSAASFADCYEPAWGRHKSRTYPAPGKKDYLVAGAQPYYSYYGANAGDPAKGYYSYDTGDWHVVVLNTSINYLAGSPQEQWLKQDLAASAKVCQVAIWQLPRYYSAVGNQLRADLAQVWRHLYAAGVELVLNADWAFYERFAPQTPDEVVDPKFGIRQIIVGTGGSGGGAFGTPRVNSEVRHTGTPGVLKLTLNANRYDWEFVPVAGKTFTDAGTGECHGPPIPTANPGGPYQSEAEVQFDGTISSDPSGDKIASYNWDFGDGTAGTGAAPLHTYTADGIYTATLTVTSKLGFTSEPASTTVTIANVVPVVQLSADVRATSGKPLDIVMRFNDPNLADGPWNWTMDWGDASSETGTASVPGQQMPFRHTYAVPGTYTITFTVTDKKTGSGSGSFRAIVAPAPVVLVGAGDIAYCGSDGDEQTAAILDTIPGTVFTVGDMVYSSGTAAEWANCYHPTWGRHKARTRPAIGNHEYETSSDAGPTFDYWGSALGERGKAYYSYDAGAWHVVVLNTQLSTFAGSPQEQWLRADLAANTKLCTLAYWHKPYFTSGDKHAPSQQTLPLIRALYDFGVEILVNANNHVYERFAPQTPHAVGDPARGIRAFTVGTGGRSLYGFITPAPNSEVRLNDRYGVLKLTLSETGYQWEFVQTGGVIGDSGTGVCH